MHVHGNIQFARDEVSMVVKVQIEVFWALMPCNVVVGYQCFRGPCVSLHPLEKTDVTAIV